ncbi:MAG: preprotein translocase subunit SecE [Patescibacteria group bacterium]
MIQRLISYISESKQELKRVNWPTRKETMHLTLIVIGVSLAVAVFLGVLDLIFRYLLRSVI